MKKLIIYDLDGTLADTREDICLAANHMITQLGGKPLPHREIYSYVGHGLTFLVKGCLKTEDRKKIEEGGKIYRRYYEEHMLDHTVLYPDAQGVLDYFRDRHQAVLTNKPDPFSRQILERLGVAAYFFSIIAGNSHLPQKPDPAAIAGFIKEKKVTPEQSLMVGDSEIDIQTARNAGIETAAVSHGFMERDRLKSLKPDYLVSDFAELLKLAKEKKW